MLVAATRAAEDMVVDRTREVVPGMVICGMEVTNPACTLMQSAQNVHHFDPRPLSALCAG
jgi:ribulose 1,5-bisphosphate synthetase/thiazole synthase